MKQTILNSYRFNLAYAEQLVADVPEELMTHHGGDGLENHPAFVLGHLISASALVAELLGGKFEMPEGWEALFRRKGPGDPRKPEQDKLLYPAKEELLNEYRRQHALVEKLLMAKTDEELQQPFQWRFAEFFPTVYDRVHFLCNNHETMHLGQLAAWRRSVGLPSALVRLSKDV